MSFRGFLEELEKAGLMRRVQEPVSPILEVTDRAWGAGPISFDNVSGHRCCLNILGTRDLLARALGIPGKDMVRHLSTVGYQGPVRKVNSSPFMECISKPDLSRLPVLTHFQGDGGPYITSAVVVSQFEGRINACVHRLMSLGKDRLAAILMVYVGGAPHDLIFLIAYVGGTLGTLLGADVLNMGKIRNLGAPVASIGGAGTFDGVFLSGLIAVLLV